MPKKTAKVSEYELQDVLAEANIPNSPDGRPAYHVASVSTVAAYFQTDANHGLPDDDNAKQRLKSYGKNAIQSTSVCFIRPTHYWSCQRAR
jgi:hypothetical protein